LLAYVLHVCLLARPLETDSRLLSCVWLEMTFFQPALQSIDYRLGALAVHRTSVAVRGGTPPPVYLNTPEWDLVP
jgi:hypothetical protein